MTMNLAHRLLCRSAPWELYMRRSVVPWALTGIDLGARTLEIGPGYGANLGALRQRTEHVTGLELDPVLARRLRARNPEGVAVITGDGARMPLPDSAFSAVTCFTMLHHVPSLLAQDALFAEAFRVLEPGGVFAGSDGRDSLGFRLLHIGDTCVPVPPESLPQRLTRVGFAHVETVTHAFEFRFRAVRPEQRTATARAPSLRR